MPDGYLTTHVLDTAQGVPAEGIKITLFALESGMRRQLAQTVTNNDGRTDAPILPAGEMTAGSYELVFEVGNYLRATDQAGAAPLFLEDIPLRFGISDDSAHYHVPLLLSPYGYSTYRGS